MKVKLLNSTNLAQLQAGEVFMHTNGNVYIPTSYYNYEKCDEILCIRLNNGVAEWFPKDIMVYKVDAEMVVYG